jgi:quinone-modifying oxidoreductase subunit QmoC
MAEAYLVQPDKNFKSELLALGGESLKQCYQCATCSVICSLSPDGRPFPRKEMIWAQWGLKDKLMGDPDIWLCHRCSDCNTHCPRGAAPGDVLAAVRDYTIQHYAVPRFLARAMARPAYLPFLLTAPAILLLVLLGGMGYLHIPEGPVEYAHFFPHLVMQVFFGGFAGLAMVSGVVGAWRFWGDLNRQIPRSPAGEGPVASVLGAMLDIFKHTRFRDCTANGRRYLSHQLMFWGFGGLFVTTSGVVVSAYVFDHYPLPLWDPLKILGNVSTVALLAGLVMVMRDRTVTPAATETSNSRDWSFIGILFTVTVTGLATEVLRFADVPLLAYPVYFVHLTLVFALLMYLPYSRFAHLIYRTVALVHARYSGREATGAMHTT